MKPVELLKEEGFELKSVYQLIRSWNKAWKDDFYKEYFKTPCMVAFVKNIKMEEFQHKRVKVYGSMFIVKVKTPPYLTPPFFVAIFIIKKTTFLPDNGFICKRDNIIKRGEISVVGLPTTVRLLEQSKESKILSKEEYLKVKKLAILEALQ